MKLSRVRGIGIAVSLFVVVCSASALEIGQQAGPVSFETLDAHPRTMSNYAERRGTVVVLLSSRCPATQEQIQTMNTVHERYRHRDVLFVGISVNPEESGDELRTFLQNNGCVFPIYRDPSGASVKQFGATVTPEFFLLDKDSKLVYHGAFGDDKKGLEPAIKALLASKSAPDEGIAATGTPIGQPAPKREIPDPYGSMHFASEFIFDKIPGVAVHHCSTIAEAANGDLLCLWYAGSYESSEDQALYLARRKSGEGRWSVPQRLVWNPEQPPGNAVIFRGPDDRIWIVWGRMESTRPLRRGSGWGQCRLMVRTSSDDGEAWTDDVEMPDSFKWLPRNVPLTLQDGTFALPISGDAGGQYAGFLLTLGEGDTWKRGGLMPGGEQPTIAQRADGSLLCLMRGHPRILQSESTDNGATWTKPVRTDLKCPDSGIAMTQLKSGRFLLVYNDTDQSDRTPFNLVQSTDGGKTWDQMKVLEADWGEFSYPSIIQSDDGLVHLTYTYRRFSIKHAEFDEGWLTTLERPN